MSRTNLLEMIIENLREFSAEYQYEDQKLSETCFRAADAIKELLKAAKAMHTWIFLNTGDEQKAYDECGLSDEMNAALGYGGQFVAEPPKEETDG